MSECINILYEDDPRMDAYYYDFESTGEKSIDAILSAVAWAGKGAHSTADWTEDWDGYGPCEEGQSAADVIQETADRAAATLQRVRDVLTECEDCQAAARLSDVFGRVLRNPVTGRDAA